MAEQTGPELPTKVSQRAAQRPDRRAARRAELEHRAEERRRVLEYDRVARLRAARLGRRKRLFWWTLPLVLLLLAAAWKAFSVPVVSGSAKDEYDAGDFADSASSYHWLQTLNVAEQWKVHFAEGTALLRDDQLEAAVDELFLAHDEAPEPPEDMSDLADDEVVPVCIVQTNLAVAHELQGDVAQGVGDGHVDRMKREQQALDALGDDVPDDGTAPDPETYKDLAIESYTEAEGLYADANEIRVWNACPDDEEARDRVTEKETSAREKREALENPPPPPSDPDTPDDPQDPPPDPQDPQDPDEPSEPDPDEPTEEPSDPSDPSEPGEPQEPQEPLTPEERRAQELERRNRQGEEERRETEGWVNDDGRQAPAQQW